MYQTISFRFMVASSKIGKDGSAPLLLSIIVNKKRVCIQLKKKLKPTEFNNNTQLSTIVDVNNYINVVRSRILEIQTDLFAQKITITAQKIKDVFNGVQINKQWGLLELYKHHNLELQKLIGVTIAKNTHDKHEYVLNYLTAYMKSIDKPIEDINTSFINGFYAYLRHDIKQKNNTAVGYMKKVKMIFKIALDDNLITKSPFFSIKYSLEKVTPTFLTEEEITKIWRKEISIKRIEQVRDIYVFNCMTGLAYIDCKNLKSDQIFKDEQDNLYIKRKRQKTKVQATIPLNEIAISILEKYNYKLPILSNERMNSYLKEIAAICGITKNLTTHTARHSAATLLLNHGVNLTTVSAVLGHSNVTITQHYAKLLDKTIINEIKGIKLLSNN
jgi:site-specific recombinase XerD